MDLTAASSARSPDPASIENIDCTPQIYEQLDQLGHFAPPLLHGEDTSDFLCQRSDFATLHGLPAPAVEENDTEMMDAGEMLLQGQNDEAVQWIPTLFIAVPDPALQQRYEEAQTNLVEEKKKSRTLREVIGDELCCSICQELFVYPHMLRDCGHVFCGECLLKWLVDMKKNACPECRCRVVNRAKAMCPVFKLTSAAEAFAIQTLNDEERAEYEIRRRNWESSKNRKPITTQRERRAHSQSSARPIVDAAAAPAAPPRRSEPLVPAPASVAQEVNSQIQDQRVLQPAMQQQQQQQLYIQAQLTDSLWVAQQPSLPSLSYIFSQPLQPSIELPPLQTLLVLPLHVNY